MDNLSSLPNEDLLRAGDLFSGRFDSVELRAADICPFKLSEPSTWLTDLSEIKGIRPVTAFSESSSTLEGVCAVMGFSPYAVSGGTFSESSPTLEGVCAVMGFSPFAVIGGTSSLSLLMPNLIAATSFFHSEVLFVDAIFERTARTPSNRLTPNCYGVIQLPVDP